MYAIQRPLEINNPRDINLRVKYFNSSCKSNESTSNNLFHYFEHSSRLKTFLVQMSPSNHTLE